MGSLNIMSAVQAMTFFQQTLMKGHLSRVPVRVKI